MRRYSSRMRFQPYLTCASLLLILAVSSGCGDESGTPADFTASELHTDGVELTGNLANAPDAQSVLVFAFLRSGEEASDEPISVGIVDEQGGFVLSGLPSGKIGLTFLADGANDGVIDPGDPIAHLADPDQQLQDLQSGDGVHLTDVQLDFRHKRAVADLIEVAGTGDSAAESTPTPEQ